MKLLKSKNFLTAGAGLAIGIINALLGAGGGMIAVALLKKPGLDQKESHVNAVAVILPTTVLSAGLYLFKDCVNTRDSIYKQH